MVKQKVRTWDVLQSHPIAGKLDMDAQLALVCEYLDLYEELQGMPLADFVVAYFAPTGNPPVQTEGKAEAAEENEEPEPSDNGDGARAADEEEEEDPEDAENVVRPASMVGMRIVYRFPGQNILSDAAGVTADSGRTVSFTDVDGESWSNVRRDKTYPIKPENYFEIHVSPREAKEFKSWLAGGVPVKDHPEGAPIRNLAVEFPDHPDKITFVIMNGKRPYVDRFVQLPEKNFEDDQKPTTRLFGEHCFRVRKKDYIVNVVTP
jgi:hypothetical protein